MIKFRNKKTGEIVRFSGFSIHHDRAFLELEDENGIFKKEITSLAELDANWEDYEDPKEVYYIDYKGFVYPESSDSVSKDEKEIGNYFESEEEARKAVEKLKAWKRLKDKGFRFKGYTDDSGDLFSCQVVRCNFNDFGKESREDLCLLFSGGGE